MSTVTLPAPVHRVPGAHRAEGDAAAPAPVMSSVHRGRKSTASLWGLTTVSVLAVWLVFYAFIFSGLQEQHNQRQLYARFREQLAKETAPLGGAIRLGAPVALLNAPAAGLHNVVVSEGTVAGELMSGPGHRADTPLPGQAGVSVIFGRSVTFGAPFKGIGRLRSGDVITATTGQGRFRFAVMDVRRAGDPIPAALTAEQGRLTLVTALGTGWRNGWAPSVVVYVDAMLTDAAKSAPAGRPAAVSAVEQQLAGDPSALIALVLWLELLLVSNVVLVWAGTRWGKWQVWLVGAPIVFALVWVVTETAARLMPNVI